MNNKQFFMLLHSAVAVVVWGSVLCWTNQIVLCLLGGAVSVGAVIFITNRVWK